MQTDEIERITRAKHYPYAIPASSYVFANGLPLRLVDFGEDPLALATMVIENPGGEHYALEKFVSDRGIAHDAVTVRRTPVLCYASNTSAEALARKFASVEEDVVIPVVEGMLRDFDAVYSAHISSYGSIPATLQWSPGTELRVFMLAMTSSQLAIMHASEGPYSFVELEDLELTIGGSVFHRPADTYISRNGALLVDGSEIALSTLVAEHRRYATSTELETLSWMRGKLAPRSDIDQFILEQILDPVIRKQRTEWLHERSRQFAGNHVRAFGTS
jgi:hypothetical protein